MIRRILRIGRWVVVFLFAVEGYDPGLVMDYLYDLRAPDAVLSRASSIMSGGLPNRGFAVPDPSSRRALIVIGPTTSGEQFINTLSHEIDHLSDSIADYYGVRGEPEGTSYLTGDTTMALADIICELGCGCK